MGFEQTPGTQQYGQEYGTEDERYKAKQDVSHLRLISKYYNEYSQWRANSLPEGVEKKGAEKRAEQYNAVAKELGKLLTERDITGSRLTKILESNVDNLENYLVKVQGEDFDRVQKQLDGAKVAVVFARQEIEHPTSNEEMERGRALFKGQHELRTEVEVDTQKELLEGILADGAASLNLSWPQNLEPKGYGGFETKIDDKFTSNYRPNSESYFSQGEKQSLRELQWELAENGINEVFGMQPTDLSHNQLVKDGKNERVYEVYYMARDTEGERYYRDYTGRGGQTLILSMVLPESTAIKLQSEVNKDPSILEKVVDSIAIKDLNISDEEWKKPINEQSSALKPPYEDWRKKDESKIYLFTPVDYTNKYVPQNQRKLDPERIKTF